MPAYIEDTKSQTAGAPNQSAQRTSSRGRFQVLVFPLAALLADLGLRLATTTSANPYNWSWQDLGVYLLGLLWALATWILVGEVFNRVFGQRRLARRICAAIIGLILAVLIMASFTYRLVWDQTPSWQVLNWALAEMDSVVMIGGWIVGPAQVSMVLVGVALCLVALWRPVAPLRFPRRGRKLLFGLFAVALYLTNSLMTLWARGCQDPVPPEANVAAAFSQFAVAKLTHDMHLVAPMRPEIRPQPKKRRPNVLLLIQESLRADAHVPDLDYLVTLDARKLSPFTSSFVDRRREGFFVFPLARTNATATESSVPAILSGLDLGGDTDAYGKVTSYWALGKAAHAFTFLLSAQGYSFSHFDEYFFDRNLDYQKTGRDLSPKRVNDLGIDDGIAVDAAIKMIKQVAAQRRPFVGVIHFNATHAPGWPGPDVKLGKQKYADVEQYSMAVKFLDRLNRRIFKALREAGVYDDTVVLHTSDHGEELPPCHKVPRLNNFHEEGLRVPIWIRIPPRLLKANPRWAKNLDAWRDGNVQNMDLLPTVRDVLGLGQVAVLGKQTLPGRSLVRPRPAVDLIRGQSTCAFRAWHHDGFFVVRNRIKFIASNESKVPQIYDLSRDPKEQQNLWNQPAWRARVLPWLQREVRAGQEISEACRRVKKICPVELDD